MTSLLKYVVWEEEEDEKGSFEVWGEGRALLALAAWIKDRGDIGFMFGLMKAKARNLAGSWRKGDWVRFP